jgi:phosphinothricin acetyltransferase
MQIVDADFAAHGTAILAIMNEAIVRSTALWEYRPRSPATLQTWFAAKQEGPWPVLAAVGPHGEVLGFASYGPFRAWEAYQYAVEHSVYVREDVRGQGVGEALLSALIARAQRQQLHVLVGAIDAGNAASIALHRKLGFVHAGTLRQVGFKFGRWLDLAFYQLTLATPETPTEPQRSAEPM